MPPCSGSGGHRSGGGQTPTAEESFGSLAEMLVHAGTPIRTVVNAKASASSPAAAERVSRSTAQRARRPCLSQAPRPFAEGPAFGGDFPVDALLGRDAATVSVVPTRGGFVGGGGDGRRLYKPFGSHHHSRNTATGADSVIQSGQARAVHTRRWGFHSHPRCGTPLCFGVTQPQASGASPSFRPEAGTLLPSTRTMTLSGVCRRVECSWGCISPTRFVTGCGARGCCTRGKCACGTAAITCRLARPCVANYRMVSVMR